jgi:hypothetical protein
MNEVIAVLVVALLAASGYAAGRMHGQFSYKLGYRFGYRQGYFDGDRATWNRRRREMQAAMAAGAPTNDRPPAGNGTPPNDPGRSEFPAYRTVGTTYASAAAFDVKEDGRDTPEGATSFTIVQYDGEYRPAGEPGPAEHSPSEGLDSRRFEAYRRPGLAGRDEGATVGVLTDAEIGHLTGATVDELGYRSDLGYGPDASDGNAAEDDESDDDESGGYDDEGADEDAVEAERAGWAYSSDEDDEETDGERPAVKERRRQGRHSRARGRELADAT